MTRKPTEEGASMKSRDQDSRDIVQRIGTQGLLSRRQFVARAAALGLTAGALPSILAACGGDDTPQASGELDFLSWEGYDLPDIMDSWKTENEVRLKTSYIASHDDIHAKILSGGGRGVDVITYGPHYASFYQASDVITPLDESKIPNLDGLFPFFASDIENAWLTEDGTRYGVPWTWGAIGLLYDSSVVDEPTSYDILFEPEFKGKVSFIDDPSGSYAAASNTLGFDLERLTEEEFEQVTDYLKELARQTKGIAPSVGDLTSRFVAGEVVLAFNGWAAIESFAQEAGKPGIKAAFPGRGGYTFVDSWAIPPNADNPDTAYAWINETLDPAINAKAAEFLVGGVTVEDAVELLPESARTALPYDDLEAFVERVPLQDNPPLESDEYITFDRMLQGWAEVKVAAG
jgi:spermidine/putrescine transport system substrate-binding protein